MTLIALALFSYQIQIGLNSLARPVQLERPLKIRFRLWAVVLPEIDNSPVVIGNGKIALQFNGFIAVGQCLIIVTQMLTGEAAIVIRNGKVRLQFDGFITIRQGLIIVAYVVVGQATIVVGLSQSIIVSDSRVKQGNRFVIVPLIVLLKSLVIIFHREDAATSNQNDSTHAQTNPITKAIIHGTSLGLLADT